MSAPTVLDVPPEVARCPFCGGALRAEVGSARTSGFGVGVVVTCTGDENATYDRLEHLIWRAGLGRWELTEATVRTWVYTQKAN